MPDDAAGDDAGAYRHHGFDHVPGDREPLQAEAPPVQLLHACGRQDGHKGSERAFSFPTPCTNLPTCEP